MATGAWLHLTTALLLLAGCAENAPGRERNSSDLPPGAGPTIQPEAPPPTHSANSCSIQGWILDEDALPVVLAQVALVDRELETWTAQDGGFSFSEILHGNLTLTVTKSGYLDERRVVACRAGETTDLDVIVLALDPTPRGPFSVVFEPRTGTTGCSWTTAGVPWGDYCFVDAGLGLAGQPRIDYEVPGGNVTALVAELVWQRAATTDATYLSLSPSELENDVEYNFTTSGWINAEGDFPRATGASPLRMEVVAREPEAGPLYQIEPPEPIRFEVRAGSYATQFASNPTAYPLVELAMQLRFELYLTLFYNGELVPAGYTNLPA